MSGIGESAPRIEGEASRMGGLVEDQFQKAVKSLVDRNSDLANIIIERDHEVNRMDVEIDGRRQRCSPHCRTCGIATA